MGKSVLIVLLELVSISTGDKPSDCPNKAVLNHCVKTEFITKGWNITESTPVCPQNSVKYAALNLNIGFVMGCNRFK